MSTDPTPPPLPHRDQKNGLVVFGVFEILLGAFCLLLVAATLLGQVLVATRPEVAAQMNIRTMLPSLMILGAVAVTLVWLGIGSIQARRWARALSLCLGAIGLVGGLAACVMLIWTLPGIGAAMRQNAARTGQPMPAIAVVVAQIVVVITTLVLYVIIPGAIVFFYGRRDVRLTCEARDPVPRWTDRCPLPVLAVVLVQIFGAASMLLMLPTYGRVFPLFGHLLMGVPAMLFYLGFAAISVYLARGFYRLDRLALWIYLAVICVFGANAAISFSGGRLLAFYRAAGLPEAQLQQLEAMPFLRSNAFVWSAVVGALLIAGYLLWLRRYFDLRRETPA